MVLGLVSALAVGAIGFVHYDQQKQRQVRGRVVLWSGWCAFWGGDGVGGESKPVSKTVRAVVCPHTRAQTNHQTQDMRRLINEEKERERQELLASLQSQQQGEQR